MTKALPQVPAWSFSEIDVVYISKIIKVPATFLLLRNEGRVVKLDGTNFGIMGNFTVVDETSSHFPVVRIRIRVPSNSAARQILNDSGDAEGFVEQFLGQRRMVTRMSVFNLCNELDYPLF